MMRKYSEIYRPYDGLMKDINNVINDLEKALYFNFIEDRKTNLIFRHILTLLRFVVSKLQELDRELEELRKKINKES